MNPLSRLLLAVMCLLTACDASPPAAPSHSPPSASRASSLVVRSDSEPSLQLLSSSLDFASQRVCGAGALKKLEVGNNSTQPRKISFLVADAPFEVTSLEDVSGNPLTLPVTLNANQGMYVWVKFNPRTTGALSRTLTVFSDDPVNNGLLAVNLTGRGTGPSLEVSPAALTLSLNAATSSTPDAGSPTDAGTASDAGTSPQGPFLGTVRLRNTGDEPLTTLALRALGPDFTADLGPKTSLSAGDSTDVAVTYAPASTSGPSSRDTLVIDNSGPCGAAQVSLTGFRSSGPVLVLDRNTLTFTEQEVGSTSAAQTVTVSNAGGAPLTVTPVLTPSSASPFVVSPSGGFTLQPQESRPLSVRFVPTAAGAGLSATLQLNGNGTPSSASVTLSGDAVVAASVDVTPAMIRFLPTVPGATRVQEITLENKGTSPVTLSTSITSTPSPSPFSVSAPSITVNAQGSAKLNVTLSVPAGAAAGAWSGQLVLATGASGSARQFSVPLYGEAVKTSVVPTTTIVQFSDQSVEAEAQKQTLVLTNRSPLPVEVHKVSGDLGPFSITDLPKEVPAGGSLALPISFKPDSRKLWEVSLQLTSTATEAIVPVLLRGQATAPELTIPTASLELDFGTQAPGTTTARRATLNNSGDAELTLQTITPAEAGNYTVQALQLPRKVPAKGSLSFDIFFNPKDRGAKKTSIQFAVGTSTQLLVSPVINVKGECTGPNVSFTPSDTLDFGNQRAQDITAVPRKIQIFNQTGAETLQILSVGFVNKTPGFSLGPSIVNQECAADKSLEAEVRFQPAEVGTVYTDTLIIRYQGKTTQTPFEKKITITGTGATSLLSFSEESLNFGAVETNKSKQLILKLNNQGKVPLQLKTISVTGESAAYFTFNDTGWPKSIPAGGIEELKINFAPKKDAAVTANLEISSNSSETGGDANDSKKVIVSMSGRGATARASISPKTISAGDVTIGDTYKTTVSIKNLGAAPLRFEKPISGSSFSVSPPGTMTWPVTIAPSGTLGDSAEFPIEFTPKSDAVVTEKITMASNDTTEPGELTLSGQGVRPQLVVDPSVDFGQVNTGEQQVRRLILSNKGKGTLRIKSLTLNSPFCMVVLEYPGSCFNTSPSETSYEVNTGKVLTLELRVKPDSQAEVLGTLVISTNEAATGGSTDTGQRKVEVKVTGAGALSIPDSTLQFGYSGVNQSPGVDQDITVTNTRSSEVKIDRVNIVMLDENDKEIEVPADFSVKSTLPLGIASNTAKKLTFTFLPRRWLGTVCKARADVFTSLDSINPTKIPLNGNVAQPSLEIARADGAEFKNALDFKQVLLDSPSRAIVLRLKNKDSGKGPLTVKASINGLDATAFTPNPSGTDITIASGQTAELSVQFKPQKELRHYQATLSLATNDPAQRTVEVPLTGQGTSTVLSVYPMSLEYGPLTAGAQTSTLSVGLINNSDQDFVLTGLSLSGNDSNHFTLGTAAWGAATYSIKPGDTYPIPVTFHPRPDVDSTAELRISTQNKAASLVTVKLSGTGLSSAFKGLRRTVDFGTQRLSEQKAPEVVPLQNDSNKTIYVTGALQGAQAADFAFEPDSLSCRQGATGIEIQTGEICPLKLSYPAQRVTLSQATLVLSVSSAGQDKPTEARVNLLGEKVSSLMAVDPMVVDFDWVDIDQTIEPRLVTVTNRSSVATRVLIPEVTNPEAFTVEALEPGRELPPAATTQLRVTFHPQEGGENTGELRLRLQGEEATDVAITLKGQVRAIGGEGGAHACGASPEGAILSGGWLLMLLGLSGRRRARGTSH